MVQAAPQPLILVRSCYLLTLDGETAAGKALRKEQALVAIFFSFSVSFLSFYTSRYLYLLAALPLN